MDNNRRQFLRTLSVAAVTGIPSVLDRFPQSVLNARTPEASFDAPVGTTSSFTIKLTANFKNFRADERILEIPGVLVVKLRQHDPGDRRRQNYPAFPMPDGSVPVLEATLILHSDEHPDWREMTVGIPLAMLKKPEGAHEITLNFSGVRWNISVDGEVLDNDFPFGYPPWTGRQTWKLNVDYCKEATLYLPGVTPEAKRPGASISAINIQYWLPPGHNSWVGDVATFSHNGRYHLFYLYDRRHHQSKFGKGAHYFEHLSTTDFRTWVEHPAAIPIEEQWECIGTGTPFSFNNKFYLSYGLHTGRIYPEEKTTWPQQWEYLKQNGRTGSFNRTNAHGIPAGATYSVCTDDLSTFRKSGVTFHPCQNPSVFTDPSGKLGLLANAGSNGVWESDVLDGGWRCTQPGFPPGGDCTFFFRWGKFDYIVGGFKGLWSKPSGAPNSAYEDLVAKGLDFYDGSNVPSITAIAAGRYVMAAWIPIRGWGGTLLLRELMQFPDGRLGSKWMAEVTPPVQEAKVLSADVRETKNFQALHHSFLLSFDVKPTEARNGKFSTTFLADVGIPDSCAFEIGVHDQRAQFAPGSLLGFAPGQKSLRQGGSPQEACDYAIENLLGVDQAFSVRILVKWSPKLGGSLVDAEIAGQRTMLSYRPELKVKQIRFHTDRVVLHNVQIARLEENSRE